METMGRAGEYSREDEERINRAEPLKGYPEISPSEEKKRANVMKMQK